MALIDSDGFLSPDGISKKIPDWRRRPATVVPPAGVQDFIDRSNTYFEECIDTETRPTITNYALAVGLPGPTSVVRLAQRVPALRYAISRCLTAIAAGYEELIGCTNATGPMFMLKNIPDFDPDEENGAPPVQFFNERKEILLKAIVSGKDQSSDEDPLDTYIRLIRDKGFIVEEENEELTSAVIRSPISRHQKALTILSEGWKDD